MYSNALSSFHCWLESATVRAGFRRQTHSSATQPLRLTRSIVEILYIFGGASRKSESLPRVSAMAEFVPRDMVNPVPVRLPRQTPYKALQDETSPSPTLRLLHHASSKPTSQLRLSPPHRHSSSPHPHPHSHPPSHHQPPPHHRLPSPQRPPSSPHHHPASLVLVPPYPPTRPPPLRLGVDALMADPQDTAPLVCVPSARLNDDYRGPSDAFWTS
ncbi:hypothetical protein C8Q80DRAFT_145015 [Daedaleopsis nitida]|nr:hypothetical protein C8Q80DRAFT_145015 [Daedaleopsis nitida]